MAQKKGTGGWRRRRRRARARDDSGSDDPSDEDFVAGPDDECETSQDFFSDASNEDSVSSGNAVSCFEEDDEIIGKPRVVRSRRRVGVSKETVIRNKTRGKRNNGISEEELGFPSKRKSRPEFFIDEEGDFDDEDDEDFAPEEEEVEEELIEFPIRKKERKLLKPRRRRKSPSVISISDDEETNNVIKEFRHQKRRKSRVVVTDTESDSSDVDFKIEVKLGDQEKGKAKDININNVVTQICGICLSEEKKEIIRGLLDCCSHFFCFACIIEWSKVESKCPVCKRRFSTVTKSSQSDAGFCLRNAVVRIPKRDQVYQPSEEEIRGFLDPYANVVCVECQQGGDDNLMLLCDLCDSPSHTYCVGLGREVPEGNWYCNGCRSINQTPSRVSPSIQGNFINESATMNSPHQRISQSPSEGISSPSPLGLTASTLFGRRSIHQRIRIMLMNDRNRRNPEEFGRNNMMQETGERILLDGRDEGSSRMNFWSFNEGSSLGAVDSMKEHFQS